MPRTTRSRAAAAAAAAEDMNPDDSPPLAPEPEQEPEQEEAKKRPPPRKKGAGIAAMMAAFEAPQSEPEPEMKATRGRRKKEEKHEEEEDMEQQKEETGKATRKKSTRGLKKAAEPEEETEQMEEAIEEEGGEKMQEEKPVVKKRAMRGRKKVESGPEPEPEPEHEPEHEAVEDEVAVEEKPATRKRATRGHKNGEPEPEPEQAEEVPAPVMETETEVQGEESIKPMKRSSRGRKNQQSEEPQEADPQGGEEVAVLGKRSTRGRKKQEAEPVMQAEEVEDEPQQQLETTDLHQEEQSIEEPQDLAPTAGQGEASKPAKVTRKKSVRATKKTPATMEPEPHNTEPDVTHEPKPETAVPMGVDEVNAISDVITRSRAASDYGMDIDEDLRKLAEEMETAAPAPEEERPQTPLLHPPPFVKHPKTPKFNPEIHNEEVDESMKQLEKEMVMQAEPIHVQRPQTPEKQKPVVVLGAKTPKFDPIKHAEPAGRAPPLEYHPSPRKAENDKVAVGPAEVRKTSSETKRGPKKLTTGVPAKAPLARKPSTTLKSSQPPKTTTISTNRVHPAAKTTSTKPTSTTKPPSDTSSHPTLTKRPSSGLDSTKPKPRPTITSQPVIKSSKPPTKSNFELPGEALSRKFAAQREERRKREEEEAEAKKRKPFKAKPVPKSVYNPQHPPVVMARSVSAAAGNVRPGSRLAAGVERSGRETPQFDTSGATRSVPPKPVVVAKTRKPTVPVGPALGVQGRRSVSGPAVKAKPIEKSASSTGPGIPKPDTAVVDRAAQAAAVLRARKEAAEKGREAVRLWAEQQKMKQAAAKAAAAAAESS